MNTPEFDWPTKYRQFFTPNPNTGSGSSDLDEFCEEMGDRTQESGFLNAANALVAMLQMNPRPDVEFSGVEYPILYCYRHYLEVAIKRVIQIYHDIDDTGIEIGSILGSHNLHELWGKAKKLMVAHCRHFTPGGAEEKFLNAVVKEFHDIDSKSMVFRYSHDKKENRTRTTIPLTDWVALAKDMKEVANFLEAQEDVVWEIQNARADAGSYNE